MNKRLLGILIIAIGLIVLVGIVYFIFIYKFSQPEEQTQPTTSNQSSEQQTSQNTEQPAATTSRINIISPVKKTAVGESDLKRMAAAFSERFGSYSNQSDYGNVRDLKIFMSSRMQAWADNYISQAIAKKAETNIYYGITTKAIAGETRNYDSDLGQAEILVKTQRREATGTTANASSFYQEIIVKFIHENGVWKVDGAFWQNR